MDYAFQFVIKNQGIDSEADYPYEGMNKPCSKEKVIASSHMYTCLRGIYFPFFSIFLFPYIITFRFWHLLEFVMVLQCS